MNEPESYKDFQLIYQRPKHNNTPSCSVYQCQSFYDNEHRNNIVKKYQITSNEEISYVENELNELFTIQHENILEVETYFVVNETSEVWIVFKGTDFSFSKYSTLNIDKVSGDYKGVVIFDIINGLEYIIFGKQLKKPRISPKQYFLFHNKSSPFPTVKYLYEEMFDEGEHDINFAYCAPECFPELGRLKSVESCCREKNENREDYKYDTIQQGRTSEYSYLFSIGIVLTRILLGMKEIRSVEEYTKMIEFVKQGGINEKTVPDEHIRWMLNLFLKIDPIERKTSEMVLQNEVLLKDTMGLRMTMGNSEDYQRMEIIGEGAFGEVYLCYDNKNKRLVAIKKGDDFVKREHQVMRLCQHENIMQVYDYFQEENEYGEKDHYIVMEYCSESNLEHIIDERELSEEEFEQWTEELIQGLYYLHKVKHLVHRDLKLGNILLQRNPYGNIPTVKISDYGMSRSIDVLMQSLVGTPQYESPQILLGMGYSEKTDLFSLGVILYRMAEREFPYGEESYEIKENVLERKEIEFIESVDCYGKHSLIKGLLEVEEEKRFGWDEIMNHSYWKYISQKKKNLMNLSASFGGSFCSDSYF